MKKIRVITEDVCSLPEKMITDFEIEIVKTKLYFPEWERFPQKNLYQLMMETMATPKTSAPSPGDYLRAYRKVLEKSEKALVIALSSKLSACYSSALQAREIFEKPEKIFVFDSLQAVASQGLLVLRAVELIREGKEMNEILEILENLKRKIKLFGFLRTTYWAEKIGRISKKMTFAFNILRILGVYPYFGTKEGKIGFSGFNLWTYDELEAMFNQLKHQAKKGKIRVGINYTDNIEIALKLKEKIEKELGAEVLFVSMVPPIVGANSGPGTLISACYHV